LKKISPQLKRFLNKYPEVEKGFIKLRGSINNFGKHAGGVLVSDVELTDLLPVRKIDGNVVSCWTEGIQGRELGEMGYIKMDLLGINAMNIVQDTLELINARHGLNWKMKELPLEDKYAVQLANKFDLMGVFQLDSPIAEKVIRDMGGMKRFEDYSAVSALMRPAALQNGFPEKFGKRRSGDEECYIPKCLEPYLEDTYGLPIYQEAAYHVAIHLANFNIIDAYKFMKLLYKGKMTEDKIPYWKEKFIEGCNEKIAKGLIDDKYANQIFNELLAFSGYGFNKCLALDTIVETKDDSYKLFGELKIGEWVKAPDENAKDIFVEVLDIMENEVELYEITLESGKSIKASLDHEFWCEDGCKHKLGEIIEEDLSIMCEDD